MSQFAQGESPLGEFHYFPLLPKELRDMVWNFAAQSQLSAPSMHFFQLQTVLEENRTLEGRDNVEKCILTVPKHSGFADGLGFRHNPSSYLNDLAVWDACCESRHLLEAGRARAANNDKSDGRIMTVRNKLPDEDLPWKKGLSGWQTPGQTCHCAYGLHQPSEIDNDGDDNGSSSTHRNLLINLEQDVLCLTLDLPNLKAFMRDGNELLEIPELRGLKDGYPVRKIALQYHPDWIGGRDGIEPQQEDGLRDVLDVLSQYPYFPLLECLYLIDYRITPRDGTRALSSSTVESQPETKVFEARGMSFHEVAKDDQDWCLPDDRPFTLLAAMAETNAMGRGIWTEPVEEAQGEEESQEFRKIRDWAGKWGLKWEQKCQFKVLACLPA
ncbi:hypothetical protein PFICI_06046 [Pestalotiopsis fici W106-1]|uniref:2EXR domain-containing protein n=1 Tax=Pestalotiopsis fici (strain W106-1 / CGMCC3.15140) TaxID=1229662 RepID=W3X4W1_PESFW|nr:uncharacterized protein PFICI_06046 [Pestalotiopsis fici W106-1]ETS81044.1 hypothetical protein PFICI_06046 [Pestalotiopsis fici W106-1]